MQPQSIAYRCMRLRYDAAALRRSAWWPSYLDDTRGGMGLPEVDLLAAKRDLEEALSEVNRALARCEKNREKAA